MKNLILLTCFSMTFLTSIANADIIRNETLVYKCDSNFLSVEESFSVAVYSTGDFIKLYFAKIIATKNGQSKRLVVPVNRENQDRYRFNTQNDRELKISFESLREESKIEKVFLSGTQLPFFDGLIRVIYCK